MAYTRVQLDQIRAANRALLGMSGTPPVVRARRRGVGDGVASTLLTAVGPITVGTSFPSFSQTFDPSQMAATTAGAPAPATPSTGSVVTDFMLNSVIRPTIQIPGLGVSYNPGITSGAPDYSGWAGWGLLGVGVLAIGGVVWVLARAFGRRSNPRRRRTHYYVYRRAAA
jgi:hypothetical protein